MSGGDYKNFCYFVSLLSIVYSSGQAGFCICFFNTEHDDIFLIYDSWCVIESATLILFAILLSYGVFKEKKKIILTWLITAFLCLLIYIGVAFLVYSTAASVMHYEFLIPILFWKFFVAVALVIVLKHYLSMGDKEID